MGADRRREIRLAYALLIVACVALASLLKARADEGMDVEYCADTIEACECRDGEWKPRQEPTDHHTPFGTKDVGVRVCSFGLGR
jgi:hypothetical protein